MRPLLRRSAIPAFLCILLCSPAGRAFGQNVSDQDLMSLGIEQLSYVKVYSASRRLEEIRDSPSSVSVITADEIRHYGWRTLADVLRSCAVSIPPTTATTRISGSADSSGQAISNSRILLMMNGHRLNENVYGSALMGTEFPLDLDLIDHIEIVSRRGCHSLEFCQRAGGTQDCPAARTGIPAARLRYVFARNGETQGSDSS